MNFPKFIYSRSEDRHFIIHTGFPRFIGEAVYKDGRYEITLLDTFPVKEGDEMVLASLLREAGNFFSEQNFIDEKISKFLFCENPLLDHHNDERSFIMHTRYPMMLAEVHHFEDPKAAQELFETTKYSTMLDYDIEQIVLTSIWLEKNQLSESKINKLLKRMADWYDAYLRWEDEQEDWRNENEEEIY